MKDIYSALNEMLFEKRSGATGTVVAGSNASLTGKKFLVDEKGELLSSELPETLYSLLKESVVSVIKTREPKVLFCEENNLQYKVFIDPIYPNAHLIILGGGHIALPLADIAKILGYEITVVDDRMSFANTARFPVVDHVICESFQKAIAGLTFTPNSYVVIVTRGHKHDKTCLSEILNKPAPAYVGMIGSRRKVTALFEELEFEGFDSKKFQSVHAPIGLDIGAQTPEEIALSIMAEITMVNHYGFSKGLKYGAEGKKHGR